MESKERLWKGVGLVLILALLIQPISALPEEVPIGGLFIKSSEYSSQLAFEYAVDALNEELATEPTSEWKLKAEPTVVPEEERYFSQIGACNLMEMGVAALIGPNSPYTAEHIQSVCDYMEMPHIETRWEANNRKKTCSVNLYPAADALSQAIYDIVKDYRWTKFTVIYENADSLQRLSRLIMMYDPRGHPVSVRQLSDDGNHRPIFKEIKASGSTCFVLDCSIDILEEVLAQAQQVGIMGEGYNYLVTTLDWHTLDLTPYQYEGTNMTGIRIVVPENEMVYSFITNLSEYVKEKNTSDIYFSADTLRVEMALMYDSVLLLTRALQQLDDTQDVNIQSLDCNSVRPSSWTHGCSLTNFMKTSEVTGLTGVIRFDTQGLRSDVFLDIVELKETGLISIANWNISEGVKVVNREEEEIQTRPILSARSSGRLDNMTFVVLIAMEAPYGMLKDSSATLRGNDRYEGYCVDLIHELAVLTGFNYTFKVQENKNYGSLNKQTGQWSGMMKEIIEDRADLAITDLTVTHDRESAVDFTMPFMSLGISLLHVKPEKQAPSLFSFAWPFSWQVWACLFMAFCFVSLELFVQARMAPKEWNNPYPCIEEPEELENQFSMNNSFWFAVGAALQQGTEIAPIAVSTRMTATMWWFFTLIMVSSYTANLAAFLTITNPQKTINSLEDLASQTKVKYGSKKGGSTSDFFKESENELYKRLWATMSKDESNFAKDNNEGVERVKAGDYAFFMESTSIEYQTERYCNLRQVGGLLDTKNYGIAMKKNAPYRNILSTGVLKLQESGKLSDIKRKWWKQRKGGGKCADDPSSATTPLGLQNVGGVFLVLVIGLAVAMIVAILELICHNYHKTKREKISFKEEMVEDIKFILRCYGSTKEVRKVKSEEDILREVLEEFQPVSPYGTTGSFQQDQATPNHITQRKGRKKSSTGTPDAETPTSSDRAV